MQTKKEHTQNVTQFAAAEWQSSCCQTQTQTHTNANTCDETHMIVTALRKGYVLLTQK